MGRMFFWLLIIYIIYKFLVRFVIPVVAASLKVRSTFKNMNAGNTGTYNATNAAEQQPDQPQNKKSEPAVKGDYIDFEEVK